MEEHVDILLKIGRRLRELRINAGYKSYETFAYEKNLPRAQYWRLEKGKTNTTVRTLVKVLTIHDMTLKEFIAQL